MKQKIFKFECDCQTNYVYAPSQRKAFNYYKNLYGIEDTLFLGIEITPIPKKEWNKYFTNNVKRYEGRTIKQTLSDWMSVGREGCGIVGDK
jgi:hypothetical protein